MNPEPIWDWPSSVQFLAWYLVEGESSKFRNSVGYITAMNALQCNAMATDAILAKHRSALDVSNGADPPGEVLVVTVLAPVIGEVDVSGHIGGLLGRSPVIEVVSETNIVKV